MQQRDAMEITKLESLRTNARILFIDFYFGSDEPCLKNEMYEMMQIN